MQDTVPGLLWEAMIGPGSPGCPRAGPAALAPGLSIRHTCPQGNIPPGDFRFTYAVGGNVARIREARPPRPMPSGAPRGKCQGFSSGARLNMLALVNAINRTEVAETFFATLTYPLDHFPTWATIERDRRAWVKRFFRQWGRDRAFIVWKKELTKRGTVHLHALIFWVKSAGVPAPRLKGEDGFWVWNDLAWAEVANTGHPDHRRVGCKVVPMRSWAGVSSYCAKYCAKPQDAEGQDTGKIWGVANREIMPASFVQEHLPAAAGKKIRRVLLKLQQRRRETWWINLDGQRVKLRQEYGGVCVRDQVAHAKAAGMKVSRNRPRCMVTRTQAIWAETVTTSAALRREVRQVEKIGEETHTYANSLHFVTAATSARLVNWGLSEALPF